MGNPFRLQRPRRTAAVTLKVSSWRVAILPQKALDKGKCVLLHVMPGEVITVHAGGYLSRQELSARLSMLKKAQFERLLSRSTTAAPGEAHRLTSDSDNGEQPVIAHARILEMPTACTFSSLRAEAAEKTPLAPQLAQMTTAMRALQASVGRRGTTWRLQ